MTDFNNKVNAICGEYLEPTQFEIYNGSLFYTAPISVSRKVFSKLMQAFDMKCQIKAIELDYYVVDFIK
jgi:hypothetical protein